MKFGGRTKLLTSASMNNDLKLLTLDELLDLMVKHPDLIQRPIVVKGEKAILARPADSVKKLL